MDNSVYEYGLLLLTGLLSAPHCIGMCGGIVSTWTLQSSAPVMQTMLAYNSGRIITYMFVGAFMGFIGSFVDAAGKVVGLQGIANIVGGLFILLWVYRKYALPIAAWTPIRIPVIHSFLEGTKKQTGVIPVFISGLLLGFIPCGLTYAMHMKAAATGDWLEGTLTLLFFGIGTLPALVFIGLFSKLISRALRNKVLYVANIMAGLIGVISICRGMVLNGWIPSINPWLW
ncbi:sulfite exporter TauE/SafE family protein [Brevibacillus sp. SYSU BS000544]|uniref:sulfite exporter TauE/SafE family protein n=1 Tax=Brevibacillus sp. SYSU BS000544 TaxID=3416443 RepID=UPI003CE4E83F